MRIANGHHVGGRKRPAQTTATHPHLFKSARRYLTGAALPTPPVAFSYATPWSAALADVLANDSLGNCTAAGACHLVDSWTQSAGVPVVLTAAQAIAFYSATTGYVPGDPSTDQGGDEVTVCTYWQQHGLDGNGTHAIAGWITADPSDFPLLCQLLYLFEGAYTGLELDASWPSSTQMDSVWSGGTPSPEDGHCIVFVGVNGDQVEIDTWGLRVWMPSATVAKYFAASAGGNIFIPLSADIVSRAQGRAPTGIDWAALVSDFDGLGGTVAPPPTSTPPNPLVNPPSSPVGPAA